jgi:hypothetical protein
MRLYMDRKLLAICILTISAVALMIANFVTPTAADTAVNSHDYQMVTAHLQGGGDALYMVDNRTGLLAIFTYDPGSRSIQPRTLRPVSDIFK